MSIQSFTSKHMITAMCIAEFKADCDSGSHFDKYVESKGDSFALREEFSSLAVSIEAAFDSLSEVKKQLFREEYLEYPCWDFSVVPWICEKAASTGSLIVGAETIVAWVESAIASYR